jgi:farnesyl diphosphate synthase
MPHQTFLTQVQQRVSDLLSELIPSQDCEPKQLHRAMRYSAMNPGKRLRPALVYATGEMLGAQQASLDIVAIAVELIHAYSLIHDDLPCMDDDDLRRGIPTCHIAFDEATAVLAGDALQTLAFELLAGESVTRDAKNSATQVNAIGRLARDAHAQIPASTRLMMLSQLSQASGSLGMGGGQAIDLLMTNQAQPNPDDALATLEAMHNMKTGALINVAVSLGYLASEMDQPQVLQSLQTYSQALGLAFQIQDDILDIEGNTEVLGKPQGSDLDKNKLTFPALLGLKGAKLRAQQLVETALEALNQLPYNSDNLAAFAHYIVQRKH